MIKQTLTTLVVAALLSVPTVAAIEDVTVGGAVLGGYNALRQKNAANHQDQFDYAANVDIKFKLTKDLSGLVQVQGSPGGASLGYPGPGLEVTDLNLTFVCPKTGGVLTAGSFDTPFGRQTGHLSNNADTFANSTILNPLLYSALAGPMGTLNTIGAMVEKATKMGAFTVALTNGTGEGTANPDGSLQTVVGYHTEPINDTISVGATHMKSNDANSGTGFNSDFDASIVDVHFSKNKVAIKAYVADLHYEDQNAATDDRIKSAMIEAKYQINSKHFVVARYNTWNPNDNNGNRAAVRSAEGNISQGLPNPGISTVQAGVDPVVDQDITRLQLGYGYMVEENVMLKTELFVDDYAKETSGKNTDTTGALAYINVRF